jgi:hypothetical protein
MLSNLADVADLMAAMGVIASLLFVAYEVRRNTQEVKRTNWETTVDRFNALWSRTTSPELADVIARGRESFEALTPAEKITFTNYHAELCLTFETMIVLGRNQVQGDDLLDIPKRHLRHHFRFPGARAWWSWFGKDLGLSPIMEQAVNEAASTDASGR